MWQAARDRCLQLGCDDAKMNAAGWVDHIRSVVVGKTVAVMIGVERFEDANGNQVAKSVAKFIGIPEGSGGSRYKKADDSVSIFAQKAENKEQIFAGVPNSSLGGPIGDDDMPF